MNARPIIFLGFDSLDLGLLAQWASEGAMPAFADVMQHWSRFNVNYPLGLEAGSAWPTLISGVPPSVHGQFDGMQIYDDDLCAKRLRTPAEFPVLPLWDHASRSGKRVAIVDLPYVALSPGLNGVQVVDWFTHVHRNEGLSTSPNDYAARLIEDYGINPFLSLNNHHCPTNHVPLQHVQQIAGFQSILHQRIDAKRQQTIDLLQAEPWHLFMTVFHEAHEVGHMLWHLHDPDHERHDAAIRAQLGDPLRAVYQHLDTALADILGTMDKNAVQMILCSHGIGPDRSGSGFLDTLLLHIERAYQGKLPGNEPSAKTKITLPKAVSRLYDKAAPYSFKHIVRKYNYFSSLQIRRKRLFLELSPNHATGGIRINLAGRDRHGVVEAGAAYDRLCQRLRDDFLAMRILGTDRPLVTAAYSSAEFHAGVRHHALPDILLEWNHDIPIGGVSSPLIGEVRNNVQRKRTGDHLNKQGMLFVAGAKPELDTVKNIDAVDLAPTIASLLGLDLASYQGRPFLEL